MHLLRRVTLFLTLTFVLGVSACGGSGGSSAPPSVGPGNSIKGMANVAPTPAQHRGGTLRIVSAEAWQHLDPGQSYFQLDYPVIMAVQRPLYQFAPDDSHKLLPDLAAGPAQISADGKTVTIHIKPDVRWSPPLNRTVTAADVKYAFDRDFNPRVPNGYASAYYPIVGAAQAKGRPIPGITTPNSTTLVFHLTKNFGATFVQSLTLPGSAAVPQELASSGDSKSPVTYDADPTKQAFDGPYMIKSYTADQHLLLVRNPNWNAKSDFRPAYADQIDWRAGGDPGELGRQTLASSDLLMADGPPANIVKSAYLTERGQMVVATLGDYYATLNTQTQPFNNVNLRRAVVAAANRKAFLLARGGELVGQVATHFLGPEVTGFNEAGGAKGFGFDFLKSPTGDMAVARKYMKAAGYPSGRYTGSEKVLIVGASSDPGPKEIQVIQQTLTDLGFKTKVVQVTQQTMYTKFCGYVKAHVTVCPTGGWIEDFPDPYAYLYVPFNGDAIVPVNNSNFGEFNDPKVNQAMVSAATITDPAVRAKAWANVDRMITAQAPAIPEVWSRNALLEGSTVHGVLDLWNDDWDLSFSSVS